MAGHLRQCALYILASVIIDLSAPVQVEERTTPSKGLSQAYALRDVAFQLALRQGCKPSELSEEDAERARSVTALIKAWAEADDRIRIHRGKPLPGSLRPERKPAKPKRARAATDRVKYAEPAPGASAGTAASLAPSSTPVTPHDGVAQVSAAAAPHTEEVKAQGIS
jgi:hypothetical protein